MKGKLKLYLELPFPKDVILQWLNNKAFESYREKIKETVNYD